jgi:hypothetical protein
MRVQIHCKNAAAAAAVASGPLFDGAVVDLASLPLLVRATAVRANGALRGAQPGYVPCFQLRRLQLANLINESDKPGTMSFEAFSAILLSGASDT